MNKYFLILYVLLFCITCEGQDKSSNEFKLSEGIYLNNLNIIIPWIIDYREIETYGKPKIFKTTKHNFVKIQWNSVNIIKNFNVDLYLITRKVFLSKKKLVRVREFRAFIDSSLASNIQLYILKLTGKNGNFVTNKKYSYTRWDVDECVLTIVKHNNFGYMLILNNNKL